MVHPNILIHIKPIVIPLSSHYHPIIIPLSSHHHPIIIQLSSSYYPSKSALNHHVWGYIMLYHIVSMPSMFVYPRAFFFLSTCGGSFLSKTSRLLRTKKMGLHHGFCGIIMGLLWDNYGIIMGIFGFITQIISHSK